jgi:inner membrane protein involved in colicin E2 resistance
LRELILPGTFVVMALIMFLTHKLDWHRYETQQTIDLFDNPKLAGFSE